MSKVIFIIFLLGIIAVAPSYCEDGMNDDDLRTFDGKVTAVDIGGQSITVKGSTEITFALSPDTKCQQYTNDIELKDINIGDYVTVQYYRSGDESRVASKVLKVTVEYKAGSGW